jgi:Tfp pilus assembly protein PilX
MNLSQQSLGRSERGAILVVVFIAVFIIAGISAGLLSLALINSDTINAETRELRAFEIAEAGAAEQMGLIFSGNGPTATGITTTTRTFNQGSYTVTVNAVWGAGSDQVTVTSVGTHDGETETVSMEFNRAGAAINEAFLKAVYAGNDSEVPANTTTVPNGQQFQYQANFGGGVDALDDNNAFDGDLVQGDVYVAGDVMRNQQARLNGEVKGLGNLMLGKAGASQHTAVATNTHVKPPNLPAMNYAAIADIKIPGTESWTYSASKGGHVTNAGSPSRIFTKNRSNMTTEKALTPKDDYFLEDMFAGGGSYANPINPGVTEKIIYVDGNVWVHNKSVIEFKWAANTKLTIVASGNIYVSDDIRYSDQNSMVAFVALKDPNMTNPDHSGNVVMGDPAFGTVDFMDGVFYAERDFKDQNVSAAGAATFEIYGGMLAGNQVDINRDWYNPQAQWVYVPTRGNVWLPKGNYHSEMNVIFDNRLNDPTFTPPPGLPTPDGATPPGAWTFLGWRRGN